MWQQFTCRFVPQSTDTSTSQFKHGHCWFMPLPHPLFNPISSPREWIFCQIAFFIIAIIFEIFLIFMFQQVGLSLLKKHKTSASLLYPEGSWGTKNSQGISWNSDFSRGECRQRLLSGSGDLQASGKLFGQEESCQTGYQETGYLGWAGSLI